MASFPVLFGQPPFGNEDRDAWLRALTQFLADPFRPIGGKPSITVPASAITGFGQTLLPYLNPNTFGFILADGASYTMGPFASFIIVRVQETDEYVIALIQPSYTTVFAGVNYSTTKDHVGTTNVYYESGNTHIQNKTGASIEYILMLVSMAGPADGGATAPAGHPGFGENQYGIPDTNSRSVAIPVADGGIIDLTGGTLRRYGVLTVFENNGGSWAQFMLHDAGTTLLHSAGGPWSNTFNTAATCNIYDTGGVWKLQNLLGNPRVYNLCFQSVGP